MSNTTSWLVMDIGTSSHAALFRMFERQARDEKNVSLTALASTTVIPAAMLLNGENIISTAIIYSISAGGGICAGRYSIRQLNYTGVIPPMVAVTTSVAISAILMSL